jgi:shikimate dehydrogenase
MPLLDKIEAGAKAIGAVNTIVVQRDQAADNYQLHGHNTDWSGFLADLRENDIAVADRDCLVLGAGGSARAVVYGLAQQGARVHLLARRVEQAVEVAGMMAAEGVWSRPLTDLTTLTATVTAPLIINTTPLGMSPQVAQSVWPDDLPFPHDAVLYDLVYNPTETKLMHQAQQAGCRAVNGLGMLVHQGAAAFYLWTGQQPVVTVMREAIR